MHELIETVEGFGSPRVALVGDFMLDRYVYGDAERLSPEAPVPVLNVVRTEERTGGAGNVAEAILALGGKVNCIGVSGQDTEGESLGAILISTGAETSGLVRLPGVPTTVKTRYVGLAQHRHAQQMLRVDTENGGPLEERVATTLTAAVRGQLGDCDVVAIEDYDKGVLDDVNTPKMIAHARKASVPVIVDPARISDYRRYRGATLLTPNRYEAELASGIRITDDESLERAARRILQVAEADAVVVTLDREGAMLLTKGGEPARIGTRARSVYDVTGAGDEVLAMLAVAIGQSLPYEDAVALANVAGGLEIERFGVVPITREEVVEELRHMIGLRGGKVLDRKRLMTAVERLRSQGQSVVFTNGCFDLLHMGHVRYLRQARELGSCLIVAINSDESIRRLKGAKRPVIGQDERAEMLGSLECVDFVTVFDEDTPEPLLELLRPDVLAKGGTTAVVVGRDIVEGYGGKVLTLDKVDGQSTTEIINRIVDVHDD